jgi:hypothetical protein
MRYQILKPDDPLDPRKHVFDSVGTLLAAIPLVIDTDLESEAAEDVFDRYPNGLAMPVPVKVGSGTVWMLGIIKDISTPLNPDAEIPFVLFVQAVAERDRERARISTHMHWNKKLWKTPVAKPRGISVVTPVELRASDLDNPTIVSALVGVMPDGRCVVYCEHNGVEMSLVFNEPGVGLHKPGGGA